MVGSECRAHYRASVGARCLGCERVAGRLLAWFCTVSDPNTLQGHYRHALLALCRRSRRSAHWLGRHGRCGLQSQSRLPCLHYRAERLEPAGNCLFPGNYAYVILATSVCLEAWHALRAKCFVNTSSCPSCCVGLDFTLLCWFRAPTALGPVRITCLVTLLRLSLWWLLALLGPMAETMAQVIVVLLSACIIYYAYHTRQASSPSRQASSPSRQASSP